VAHAGSAEYHHRNKLRKISAPAKTQTV